MTTKAFARPHEGSLEQPAHLLEENGELVVLPEKQFSQQLEATVTADALSLEKKDRPALLSHISSLQKELYDYQYQMGLLLLECKNWGPRYDKLKAVVTETDENWQRQEILHSKALVEAKRREEALKESLEIEKQCILDLEKALKEMQLEVSEGKEAANKQLLQARKLANDTEEKSLLAESKLHSAEALHAEASRKLAETERKLQEIGAREAALRREQHKMNAEYEARKGDLDIEEENLQNWEKRLQEGQDRLHQGEKLLSNREEYVYEKEEALKHLGKDLKDERALLEKEHSWLRQEEVDLNARMTALSLREKIAVEREVSLDKKEQELLVSQEKLADRERVFEKLEQEVRDKEASLAEERKKLESSTISLQQMEDSMAKEKENLAATTKVLDHKSKNLSTWKEGLQEKAINLEKQHQSLLIELKDLDTTKRLLAAGEADIKKLHENVLKEKEQCQEERDKLKDSEKDLNEMLKQVRNRERDLADEKKQFMAEQEELQQQLNSLKKQIEEVEETKKELELEKEKLEEERLQLEVVKQERETILNVQVQLKEEIDSLRACKQDVQRDVEDLKVEKERFEKQWEFLDEKKEQLKKEDDDIEQQRRKFAKWIQDQESRLREEKHELWQQIQKDSEILNSEKRAFVLSIEVENADLFSKIQREREELAKDMELRGAELERCLEKKQLEIERKNKELELKWEETRKKEKQELLLLKENAQKEMEFVLKEKQKLEKEREELLAQKDKLEPERSDIKGDIMELQTQREKLMVQREALHKEKQTLMEEAERLKRLRDDVKQVDDSLLISEQFSQREMNEGEVISPQRVHERDHNDKVEEKNHVPGGALGGEPLFGNAVTPGRLSWLQRCASIFFQPSSEVKTKPFGKEALGKTWAETKVQSNEENGDLMEKADHKEVFSSYRGRENRLTADEQPKKKSISSRGMSGGSSRKNTLRNRRTHSVKAVIEDAQKILAPLKFGLENEKEDIQQESEDASLHVSESDDHPCEGEGLQGAVGSPEAGASVQQQSVELRNLSNGLQKQAKSGRKRVRSASHATSEQETDDKTIASRRFGGKRCRHRESLAVDSPTGDDTAGTPGAKRYNFRNSTIASMMASQTATGEDKELGAEQAISKYSDPTHDPPEISSPEPEIHKSSHDLLGKQIIEKSSEAADFCCSQVENLISVVALQVVLDGSVISGEETLLKVDVEQVHNIGLAKDLEEKNEHTETNEAPSKGTASKDQEEDEFEEQSQGNHIHQFMDDEDTEEEIQEQDDDGIVLEDAPSPLQKLWNFLST